MSAQWVPGDTAMPAGLQPIDSFVWALRRDLSLAARRRADIVNLFGFFIIACSMFPLAIGPQQQWLHRIGPGVIWVAALLATLLAAPRLFEQDHQDGSLEQMLASGRSTTALVGGKLLAAWLTGPLPLVAAIPVLGLAFHLPLAEQGLLAVTLLLGTPTLMMLAALASALTLGLRSAATLVTLLCLPLFVPVLIFGAGAPGMLQAGLAAGGHVALLAAGTLIALLVAPPLTALALRVALE